MKKILYLYLAVLAFSSCTSKKEIIYFQDIPINQERKLNQSYADILQPDDVLSIVVSSSDDVGIQAFNLPFRSIGTGVENQVQQQQSYLVKQDGTIDFPVLGSIKLADLTRLQATQLIKDKLKQYLNEPIVNIELLNFKVTILGEVARPGTYPINQERVTILEAIGMAGDLNITGVRTDILVIREINQKQINYRVDLTSQELFNSEVYYLKKNDVVYVSPNKAQVRSASYNRNTAVYVSLASVVISLIAVLSRL